MRMVVIGGSGLVGAQLVDTLRHRRHDVLAASRKTGVNTLTGEGLAEAISGANVVIDVTNSPAFDDATAMSFFQTSCRNLIAAAAAAHVKHHVVLSVVGTDPRARYFGAELNEDSLTPDEGAILGVTRFEEWLRQTLH